MAENIAEREAILDVRDLDVVFRVGPTDLTAVRNVDLEIFRGEAVGLVGESGSGKTTLALAVMGYLGLNGRVRKGQVLLEGADVVQMSTAELRAVRGRQVAMIYQEPMSSLNPLMTIGHQLDEVPLIHATKSRSEARELARQMLAEVDLPDPDWMLERYPHQLSGGQQQRVVIAMALITNPALLVMDEPTTALDVTVEAGVLDLVHKLRERHNIGILFISHNLRTIAQVCDRIAVMYAGDIVENGTVEDVFRNPSHPYTVGLFDCLPTFDGNKYTSRLRPIPGKIPSPTERAVPCMFMDRCGYAKPGLCDAGTIPLASIEQDQRHLVRCARIGDLHSEYKTEVASTEFANIPDTPARDRQVVLNLKNVEKRFFQVRGFFRQRVQSVTALHKIDLEIKANETLAIVGESGSGKSTLVRAICGLTVPDDGRINLDTQDIGSLALDKRPMDIRRRLQMVFQNPDSTLNPSHTIGFALERIIRRLEGLDRQAARERVKELLKIVRLSEEYIHRYPDELSGGQKQRIGIARALVGDAEIILADEPVSALDVSVQAAIINLLGDLQQQFATALIFISHDLSVVRHIADKVAVMYLGNIVEFGTADEIFNPPFHPYTEALLSAVPPLTVGEQSERIVLNSPSIASSGPIVGCPFAARCHRRIGPICDDVETDLKSVQGTHQISCHIEIPDLATFANASGQKDAVDEMPSDQM